MNRSDSKRSQPSQRSQRNHEPTDRLEWPVVEPERPFTEPWQAQVFALTVHLNNIGRLPWSDWADMFGRRLNQPDAAVDGSDYYHHWAATLEEFLHKNDLAPSDEVDEVAASWRRAAEATPHGSPIELANDPRA